MGFADDYVPVAERLVAFREQYPEGCLRPANPDQPFTILMVEGETFLAYTAAAYRNPDDPTPGIGCAWEPVPGKTNFTRNSELQNAESSAWGRAIIAVGAADAKRGIATAEDVQWRQAEADQRDAEEQAVGGLRSSLQASVDKWVKDRPDRAAALKAWFAENDLPPIRRMNASQAERVIDHLMSLTDEESAA